MYIYERSEFLDDLITLTNKIESSGKEYSSIYFIPRGGALLAHELATNLNLPIVSKPDKKTLVVDDLIDSGKTRLRYPDHDFACLHIKPHASCQSTYYVKQIDDWIHYWWEGTPDDGIRDISNHVTRMLEFIGENPNREGLKDTPKRIVKSWNEIFSGYRSKPEEVLSTFSSDGYDEMVLLKDIEFYSMCEHHMLPFFGKAHIAYIPDGKVIGISKLARLLDIFARRLQIQERICEQVTSTLMDILKPKGTACVLEAQHLCMLMRGVQKQNSVMTTSSLKGVFLQEERTRVELMSLINR